MLIIENNIFTTYSVPDGVLNGGVGTFGGFDASTEPGGNVKFNLFFDILLIFPFSKLTRCFDTISMTPICLIL